MKNCIFLFLLVCSWATIGQGQTAYYVSTKGDNQASGTLNAPWRTIQYGIEQIQPGDSLLIMEGTYYEKLDLSKSGIPGQYLTLKSYNEAEVILSGKQSRDNVPLIFIGGAFIRVEGLHITDFKQNDAEGISIQGTAHDIVIQNNRISQIKFSKNPNAPVNENTNAVPLGVLGDVSPDSIYNIFLLDNELFDNQTGYSENLTLGGNVSGFVVEGNLIHDNTNIGIDVTGNYLECPDPHYDHARNGVIRKNTVFNCYAEYSTAAGIYIDGGWNIIVENNVTHHNGYGGEIGCEENGETRHVTFRNNIFYNNRIAGMHIGGYDRNTTGNVIQSAVRNNTFYHNDINETYNGELILSQSVDCSIENNLFYLSTQNVYLAMDRTQKGLKFDYNLVFADAGKQSIMTAGNIEVEGLDVFYRKSGYGMHDTWGNPQFFDAGKDFHLSPGSPAINAGNPVYTAATGEKDLDGQNRINEGRVDCGADEFYVSTRAITEGVEHKNSPWIYPLPAGDYIFISGLNPSWESYRISTLDGKIIRESRWRLGGGLVHEKGIDISDLSPGTYLILLRKNKLNYTIPFVKL